MIDEIIKLPATKLAAVTFLILLVVPTGTTVVYLLNKPMFVSLDSFKLIMFSLMYVFPVAFSWYVLLLMNMTMGREIDWMKENRGREFISASPKLEEKDHYSCSTGASVCAIASTYLIIVLSYGSEKVFGWHEFQLSLKTYIIGSAILPGLFFIILFIAMKWYEKELSDMRKKVTKAK